jgi:hypothetical protein
MSSSFFTLLTAKEEGSYVAVQQQSRRQFPGIKIRPRTSQLRLDLNFLHVYPLMIEPSYLVPAVLLEGEKGNGAGRLANHKT